MSPTDGRIPGFEYLHQEIGGATYNVAVAGDGPAVLLLHGYPQTHFCWRFVGPELAHTHTVVVPDLRGYGETKAPPGGPAGEGYSKREMGADMVALLDQLGFEDAAVVGHDRGGRVAYRMALDSPGRVERLGLLSIVPTVEQFDRVTPEGAIDYWPWFFLAQPEPFPERLVAGEPEFYVRSLIESWAAWPERIGEEAISVYADAMARNAIPGSCADYRASFHLDRALDGADRSKGRRIECPTLVLWGELDDGFTADGDEDEQAADELAPGPLEVWRRWAERVEGGPIASGHFIPEEAPSDLVSALRPFLEPRLHATGD
jgi:haloacetate dehalogenase